MLKNFALSVSILCLGVSLPFTAPKADVDSDVPTSHIIYEQPTVEAFSQLYWAVGRLDPENEDHLDNFMRINECDIYEDYINHEFEWVDIRKSARSYIEENVKNFPLRFEFTQRIKLTHYDLEKQEFSIEADQDISGIKRFFMPAKDAYSIVCGSSKELVGYPKKLLVELSKPFTLEKVPMEKDRANKFITERLGRIKEMPKQYQKSFNPYDTRNVIMVMNIKLFSNQGAFRMEQDGNVAHLLGVLESFQIYSDKEREDLLLEQDFRNKRQTVNLEKKRQLEEEERLILEQAAARKKARQAAAEAAQDKKEL